MKRLAVIIAILALAGMAYGQDFDGAETSGGYTNIVTGDNTSELRTGDSPKVIRVSVDVKTPAGERLDDGEVTDGATKDINYVDVPISDWASELSISQNTLLLALKTAVTNKFAADGLVPSE